MELPMELAMVWASSVIISWSPSDCNGLTAATPCSSSRLPMMMANFALARLAYRICARIDLPAGATKIDRPRVRNSAAMDAARLVAVSPTWTITAFKSDSSTLSDSWRWTSRMMRSMPEPNSDAWCWVAAEDANEWVVSATAEQ